MYLQCNHFILLAACLQVRVLLTIGVRLLCQRKCPSVPIGSRSHEDLDLECHGPPKTERNLSGIKCDSNALLGRTSIRQVSIKTPKEKLRTVSTLASVWYPSWHISCFITLTSQLHWGFGFCHDDDVSFFTLTLHLIFFARAIWLIAGALCKRCRTCCLGGGHHSVACWGWMPRLQIDSRVRNFEKWSVSKNG